MSGERTSPRDVFRAPKGTHDILPPASHRFAAFVDAFSTRADQFGYGLAVTPLFEHLEVFLRVGESTDVVTKEMYEFTDKGDRRLALRPEGTASVVRAFVEHRPTEPWKVFYSAPNFRYERPQKGRYRQHWQVGAEVIGTPDPDLDVEVIDLAAGFFASLGLSRVRLKMNSMGDAESRDAYIGRLQEYLAPHVSTLGDDFGRMLAENPLRILDSKNPAVIDVIERAPQLPEHLSADAAAHFEQVQAGLNALGIPFELEPRLVRGFDYYTGTTFEFAAESLDAAQDAIGGGGRYDGLAAEMGGPDVSGIGFGIGIERALLACDAEGVFAAEALPLDVFVVDLRVDTTTPEAAIVLHELRLEGLTVEKASGGRSEKAQWKLAARHGARFTVVLESGASELTVRERSTGEEHKVPRELVVGWLYERGEWVPPVMRTHECGTLGVDDVGTSVIICGWVANHRDHGGVLFVDVRDASGLVQVVIDPEPPGGANAPRLRSEYVARITGDVRTRPEGTVNPELPTGQVEIAATAVEVLAESEPPPFPLDGRAADVDEGLRLKHRYLDLRRPSLQRNLRLRAKVNHALRASMDAQRFVEVETPMLIASTPEGARDFVVPSRLHPGEFYALPQSPQLFKQLLMVGGLERYFQIARCLRDEDLRADRQFEFMQYDMEMSFAGAADVQAVVTEAVGAAVEAVTGERPGDFSRMTWQDAMDRYGSDKPDIRFGLEITDLASVFASTGFRAFQAEAVRGIRVPGRGDMGRNKRDGLIDRAKALGAMGLVSFKVEGGVLVGNGIQHLSADEQGDLLRTLGAVDGDLVLIVAGAPRMVSEVLGALRLDLARPPVNEGGLNFAWIDDFPLFEGLTDDGSPIPAHHPFTMPHPDDLELLASASGEDLLKVRSLSYDLVLNGWELGSGSVRIHTPDVQAQIFTLLGISDETAAERFGFLLEAFRYGAPPHAGFAFGTDRLTALLAGEENIREVIAFPKTQSGADPLTGAPTPIDPTQLRDLGLQLKPRPK